MTALWAAPPVSSRRGDKINRHSKSPKPQIEKIIQLNESLKTAVCDESYVSKPPSLESVSLPAKNDRTYLLKLSQFSESDLVSFLLGDSLIAPSSDHVREKLAESFKARGLDMAFSSGSNTLSNELFLEAQATATSVKRKASLEICESLIQQDRFKQLFQQKPSRFLEVAPASSASVKVPSRGQVIALAFDPQNRFGHFKKDDLEIQHLAAGWIEPYEVEHAHFGLDNGLARSYQRISNPLTNNMQAVELLSREGVPIGTLFLAHDPSPLEWAPYRAWSEATEARTRQIESYRQRIEFDAIRALEHSGADRTQVRNLQDFYKNLLQAYRLMPDEKQFQAYAKSASTKRMTFDEITKSLGQDYLSMLSRARVNGSFVRLWIFRPDPKLHAIYTEYAGRLNNVRRREGGSP